MAKHKMLLERADVLGIICGLVMLCASQAWALDPYLYGAIGQANGQLVDKPGLWRQEGLPYTTDLSNVAFRAGVGLRTEIGVFVELGYLDPGTYIVDSEYVPDHKYDPVGRRCLKDCDQLDRLNLHNEMRGGELVVGYEQTFLGFFKPYIKGGIAGFAHTHSGTYYPWPREPGMVAYLDADHEGGNDFSGVVISGVVGGGLCATMARVDLCGDVGYYPFFAHTANPLLDSFIMTTAQVRVPLTGW